MEQIQILNIIIGFLIGAPVWIFLTLKLTKRKVNWDTFFRYFLTLIFVFVFLYLILFRPIIIDKWIVAALGVFALYIIGPYFKGKIK